MSLTQKYCSRECVPSWMKFGVAVVQILTPFCSTRNKTTDNDTYYFEQTFIAIPNSR